MTMGARSVGWYGLAGVLLVGCAHDGPPSATARQDGAERATDSERDAAERQLDVALGIVASSIESGSDAATRPMAAVAARAGARLAEMWTPVYEERAGRAIFTTASGLTASGDAAWTALRSSHEHALDPDEFRVAELSELAAKREALGSGPASSAALTPVPDATARERLLAALQSRGPAKPDQWAQWLLAGEAGPESKAFPMAAQQARDQSQQASDERWRLEAALADGIAAYALRLSEWGRPVSASGESPDDDEDVVKWQQAREQKVRELFRALAAPGGAYGETLAALGPPVEQYGRLLRAYARYRTLCAEGEWPIVGKGPRLSRKAASTGDRVARLRERLRAEGYFHAAAGPQAFDDALHEAVLRYQQTHQFIDDGVVDKSLVGSLDTPCTERLAQIGVTLERWRHTHVADPAGRFVQINIPDFHGEVWDAGARVHRFRVITGKKRNFKRRDGTRIFKFATPEMASRMKYVVFNPYWNIPESIRRAEIEPELLTDPGYLEKHNYEIVELDNGSSYIRQRPGPGNALGRVKFLFPNPYDVYLHDTPTKRLFQSPVRAFSHGCMRVHEPMQLAEILLTLDGSWKDYYSHERDRLWVNLEQPIPVHVEYYVVRVDDEGWAHFNADIYHRDEVRLAQWLERFPTGAPGPVAGLATSPVSERARITTADDAPVPSDAEAQ